MAKLTRKKNPVMATILSTDSVTFVASMFPADIIEGDRGNHATKHDVSVKSSKQYRRISPQITVITTLQSGIGRHVRT